MLEVREGLKSWPGRALVLFSDSDPIFSPRVGERFAELIPGAEPCETVVGAGHFLQEDQGEELGERIARWLRP
jgi:haloalkane dehalogenase